jgi:hypothetical protein
MFPPPVTGLSSSLYSEPVKLFLSLINFGGMHDAVTPDRELIAGRIASIICILEVPSSNKCSTTGYRDTYIQVFLSTSKQILRLYLKISLNMTVVKFSRQLLVNMLYTKFVRNL